MDDCCNNKAAELDQPGEHRSVLKVVLVINFVMFFVECGYGWLSKSTALMADSLDMLGDAFVYGVSIYAIGKSIRTNAIVSLTKGIVMLAVGIGVLIQAAVRFNSTYLPVAETIGIIGGLALLANLTCASLLLRFRKDNLNMRSVWLCSRNDVIANTGVLIAAAGVALTQSKYPDLVVGVLIATLFLRSSYGVLKESVMALKST